MCIISNKNGAGKIYLSNTLLMLPPVQHRPRNAARVLALQEERFGFAVLKAEDFAVAADVKLTLFD